MHMPNPPILEYHDIPYISADPHNSLRKFDLYVPVNVVRAQASPLVCFVHGGAWRSEDKTEHATLARNLAARTTFPVAVPNYRLTTSTTPLRHPAHAADLLAFLNFLLVWPGPTLPVSSLPPPLNASSPSHEFIPSALSYDPTRLYLLTHSCSAHMLASILLAPPTTPTADPLAPTPALIRAVRAVVFSEGIFDLDLLLKTFPAYRGWFVAAAFGDRKSYAELNVAQYVRRDGVGIPNGREEGTRWLVVHSRGDTLVDEGQSAVMWARLRELYPDAEDENLDMGKQSRVERCWDVFEEDHDEMLRGETYLRVVGGWIVADVAAHGYLGI